ALPPPGAQQREQLRRQHGMAVFAALALLDPQQHALGVDVADLECDDFGAGLTSIEAGNDDYCRQPSADEAGAVMGRAISVPMLRRAFRLSVRRIAGYLENGQPLDLTPAQDAAEAVASREEEFVYRGQPDFRLPGLLTHEGRQQLDGGDWAAVERALGDVLAAVTQLDDAGYRGPYALALAPPLYNGLFRLYPGTD